MQSIPIHTVPNQTLAVTVASQSVQIAIRQNGAAMYFDLKFGDEYVVQSRICRDRQRLLLDRQYKGFVGDFMFVDTQGATDPQYSGLGRRYVLRYLASGE